MRTVGERVEKMKVWRLINDRQNAITAVRLLLGVQCVLSGLNWWVQILPFPNMHVELTGPAKHEILTAMIDSGWMFTSAKVIEIAVGLALLFNRYAILLLVIAFPILFMTFILDFTLLLKAIPQWIGGEMSGRNFFAAILDMLYFGAGVWLMQCYLMCEWFSDYRQLFAVKPGGAPAGWSKIFESRGLAVFLRWGAYLIGGSSTLWLIGMLNQWLIPWSSLALLAPVR